MKSVLLIDFGSTYTKVCVVDVESERLLGTAQSFTTVATDINDGLNDALETLSRKTGITEFDERYACSSAAGGLRMVTCGLVPSLTAQAAKTASLGAGAKVIKVFSYELNSEDIAELENIKPEILLLTGGTDGGNSQCIINNAKLIGGCAADFPVIVAGNRSASDECCRILERYGRSVYKCENVMPSFNVLNAQPAQELIRKIFLERIISAKGLSRAQELISGIMMPTPAAVLQAITLLSQGIEGNSGIGELMAVDLGGATTDVYSAADGVPDNPMTIIHGLPEPYTKRTVEGDIGMRYSVHGIIEATSLAKAAKLAKLTELRCAELIEQVANDPSALPQDSELGNLDFALASLAIDTALTRHSGTVREAFTPMGMLYEQTGKDLTRIQRILLTGGAIIHARRINELLNYSNECMDVPNSLKPRKASVMIDRTYTLSAMGLLSEKYPDIALKIMKKELDCNGNS